MTATNGTERLWDAHEVAAYLGVTHWWVSRERRAGRFPGTKVGRYNRYDPADVREWQAAQTTPAITVGRTARSRTQAKRNAAKDAA